MSHVNLRIVLIGLAAALLVSAAVPPVTGAPLDRRSASYVASPRLLPDAVSDAVPVDQPEAPQCDWEGTGRNLGGVCFALDGEIHRIDVAVEDFGQWRAYQALRHLPYLGPPQPTAYPLVSATYRLVDADGTVRVQDSFCGYVTDLHVPSGAKRLEVAVDGGLAGAPAVSPCGTWYAGATYGDIHLTIDW